MESMSVPPIVQGTCASAFAPVAEALAAYGQDETYAAQLCIYHGGREVVDLWIGAGIQGDSLTGVFSASKGIGGVVIGLLLERGLLDADRPVSQYWPAFAQSGKSRITVADLLSHRAGLIGVPGGFTWDELMDSQAAAARLAMQAPSWRPGRFHGYHAFTIGVFADELCRRITGRTLRRFYEEEVRVPCSVDFHLGLPEAEEHRFVDVRPAAVESAAIAVPLDDLATFAFNGNPLLLDGSGLLLPNNREFRGAGNTSVGGVASARGLARLYACALGGGDLPALFGNETVAQISSLHSAGMDLVLASEKRFGLMFLKPEPNTPFGSHRAFGHDGAGGTLGFADPEYQLAFGYNVWPMVSPGGADPRAVALSRVARLCASRQAALPGGRA